MVWQEVCFTDVVMRRLLPNTHSINPILPPVIALIVCMTLAALVAAQIPVPPNGVIAQPGQYYLQSDMIVSRDTGIRIDANNVTLDLAGHALRFEGPPHVGTFGIVSAGRTNVRITNGAIGAFWFNVHASQNTGLQIDNVKFDDVAYIGINAAVSQDVIIRDNTFTNFRYDIPKAVDPYVIGINIGAEDAVVTRNTFEAVYNGGDPNEIGVETVMVLFSANVSQRSVVTHNEMSANSPLNRSYGLWVASNAHVTAMHNTIQNMRYGITLASNATALAGYNDFVVDAPSPGVPSLPSTFGVYAVSAEQVFETGNRFQGQTHPTFLPPNGTGDWDNTNMVLALEVNDLASSLLPGVGYDSIDFAGAFTHGGAVAIDMSAFEPGPVSELRLVGWTSEVGNSADTAVAFIGGPTMPYEFRDDGLYVAVEQTLVGDYDGNGTVDAADYSLWRDAYGTPALYDAWRIHFGQIAVSGLSAGAAGDSSVPIPEPAAQILWTAFVTAAAFTSPRRSAKVNSSDRFHRQHAERAKVSHKSL